MDNLLANTQHPPPHSAADGNGNGNGDRSVGDGDGSIADDVLLDEGVLSELKNKAIAAKEVAYCPYSHFRVGAALLTDSGAIISGANVECASFPVGVCAERCALVKAVTDHQTTFTALAVATDITPPASPCGMCRQFIREFCPLSMPIFMYDKDGDFVMKRLEELLPMSFGPGDLKSAGG